MFTNTYLQFSSNFFLRLFAETAHFFDEPLELDIVQQSKLAKCNIDLHQIGVWIDPIGKVRFFLA